MSDSFTQWSHGLSESSSFQEFMAYIEESTPRVLDLFGSLVNMIVELGKAAAPVGDIMVPALARLADAISLIADSPLGPRCSPPPPPPPCTGARWPLPACSHPSLAALRRH